MSFPLRRTNFPRAEIFFPLIATDRFDVCCVARHLDFLRREVKSNFRELELFLRPLELFYGH
jgi:hypothetical protein